MLQQENLAANFYGLLASQGYTSESKSKFHHTQQWKNGKIDKCSTFFSILDSANEFKILGQERDGSIVTSWITRIDRDGDEQTIVGIYMCREKRLEVLKKFSSRVNVIQASANQSRTLLVYVLKDQIHTENSESDNSNLMVYKPYLSVLQSDKNDIRLLEVDRVKQVFLQFLWPRQPKVKEQDKLLLMIHEEGIQMHTIRRTEDNDVDADAIKCETIVKNFVWSQWEAKTQSLFYIHLKLTTKISFEKEEDDKILSPTLSAFQFNDDLPTETVINIPLNLPKIPSSSKAPDYEDDVIPLRIHDSSLNLMIVADDDKGMLFICHYYLYQPMRQHDEDKSSNVKEVHFAYSVTMVHCSVAVHCIIPGVTWEKAKHIKPTFAIVDDRLIVFQPNLLLNLISIGLDHEPFGHITSLPLPRHANVTHLVPCFDFIAYDSATLDLHSLQIPKSHLLDTFRSDTSFDNRLSIIHYLLSTQNDFDAFMDLLNIIMDNPLDLDTDGLFKEALVAGTFSALKKGLSQDALALIKYLPLTTINNDKPTQAKLGKMTVGLSMESLHNTAMMLLSPQQRLNPYRFDIWTRLYDRLNNVIDVKKRFTHEQVTDKLVYSLQCYQPEALSRATTPQTPSAGGQMSFGELSSVSSVNVSSRKNPNDVLPFIEFETCTASKQEHVISVNLRELSMHLVKYSVKQTTGFRWLKDYEPTTAPSFVHAVSTRYVSAQLEISRLLCVFVCRACGVDARVEVERGFKLIDKMLGTQRLLLFMLFERYVTAVDSMAFPTPQGFSSFFTYLGYKALETDKFMQYAEQHVFELQIDVMKVIMNGEIFILWFSFYFVNECVTF